MVSQYLGLRLAISLLLQKDLVQTVKHEAVLCVAKDGTLELVPVFEGLFLHVGVDVLLLTARKQVKIAISAARGAHMVAIVKKVDHKLGYVHPRLGQLWQHRARSSKLAQAGAEAHKHSAREINVEQEPSRHLWGAGVLREVSRRKIGLACDRTHYQLHHCALA